MDGNASRNIPMPKKDQIHGYFEFWNAEGEAQNKREHLKNIFTLHEHNKGINQSEQYHIVAHFQPTRSN